MNVETEATTQGEQTLMKGVRPVTLKQRLEARKEAPLEPRCAQRPLDFGLFDMSARNQLSLF
jgi:hypothetical protein